MQEEGLDAGSVYLGARQDGVDKIAGIRMLRELYQLSLIDAKKMSFKIDTGEDLETAQSMMTEEITKALEEN